MWLLLSTWPRWVVASFPWCEAADAPRIEGKAGHFLTGGVHRLGSGPTPGSSAECERVSTCARAQPATMSGSKLRQPYVPGFKWRRNSTRARCAGAESRESGCNLGRRPCYHSVVFMLSHYSTLTCVEAIGMISRARIRRLQQETTLPAPPTQVPGLVALPAGLEEGNVLGVTRY